MHVRLSSSLESSINCDDRAAAEKKPQLAEEDFVPEAGVQPRTIPITALVKETVSLIRDRRQIRQAMRSQELTSAFRERLMLAVTSVNRCRYCSYAHSKMALNAGLSADEVADLCGGIFESCPADEVPALLYAEHWAETNAMPDSEARQNAVDRYGEKLLSEIEVVLRMIRMGNMYGNLWDRFLHRISFGRMGSCS
jgi:AhpD family alkylhydroperoxidase